MFTETGSPTAPDAASRGSRRRAFTLTELLIVMGVIILAVTLAIPAIRALTGSRSEQAAQNTLSAFLARARTDAIGLQKVQGVLFFLDPANNRATCVQVMEVPITTSPPAPQRVDRDGIVYLDVTPDHDVMVLPAGILPLTLKESSQNPVAGLYPTNRYLGFNNYENGPVRVGGVILFDAEGRAVVRSYGLHLIDLTVAPNGAMSISLSAMGRLIGFPGVPATDWPIPTNLIQWLRSQISLVLIDRQALAAQNSGPLAEGNDPNATAQQAKEQWIDQNATPIFVNRYNGTLTRAELIWIADCPLPIADLKTRTAVCAACAFNHQSSIINHQCVAPFPSPKSSSPS